MAATSRPRAAATSRPRAATSRPRARAIKRVVLFEVVTDRELIRQEERTLREDLVPVRQLIRQEAGGVQVYSCQHTTSSFQREVRIVQEPSVGRTNRVVLHGLIRVGCDLGRRICGRVAPTHPPSASTAYPKQAVEHNAPILGIANASMGSLTCEPAPPPPASWADSPASAPAALSTRGTSGGVATWYDHDATSNLGSTSRG